MCYEKKVPLKSVQGNVPMNNREWSWNWTYRLIGSVIEVVAVIEWKAVKQDGLVILIYHFILSYISHFTGVLTRL